MLELWLKRVNGFVWGAPALVLILGTGAYLSWRTRLAPLHLLPRAFSRLFRKTPVKRKESGAVSPFQALCTALGATVGTGNIVGVAGAIAIGGPGAVFWIWVCALFGMVIKFAEATLCVRFREKRGGEIFSGPMHMIRNGLPGSWRFFAGLYSFFGVIAAFGVGNATQINAVITGVNQAVIALGGRQTRLGDLLIALILALFLGRALLGGVRSIAKLATALVPAAAVLYILLCLGVLLYRAGEIPGAVERILVGAISPQGLTGGAVGSAFMVLRIGVSRGVFTNEAGMGTAGIAHGTANVAHPVEQGMMGVLEVFVDTVVICTMTALAILVSDVPIPYGQDIGAALTARAFSSVYGDWALVVIAACLCCFAVATVLGWGLYGARCAQYLFGDAGWKPFVVLQCVIMVISSFLSTGTVWMLSEIFNGLMAIPNLLALVALTPELLRILGEYYRESLDNSRWKMVK